MLNYSDEKYFCEDEIVAYQTYYPLDEFQV
jgi:hypothetical protein